jgi:hypothetical protein
MILDVKIIGRSFIRSTFSRSVSFYDFYFDFTVSGKRKSVLFTKNIPSVLIGDEFRIAFIDRTSTSTLNIFNIEADIKVLSSHVNSS